MRNRQMSSDVRPRVIISPDLDDRLESLEFDHDKYVQSLRARGLSDDEISKTVINFTTTDHIADGWYHEYTGMCICIGPKPNERIINRVLKHETQHRVDHVEGNWHKPPDSMYVRMGAAALLGIVAMSVPGPENVESFATRLLGVAVASFAAGTLSTKLNGTERRSRAVEHTADVFINVKPRNLLSKRAELGQDIKFRILRTLR